MNDGYPPVTDLLTDQAYRTLRQQIIDGVYRPSQHLVEADLAQSLGVSRISVRSALQRLHQEGLITLQPHRGAKVTDISLEEALQVMEVRQGLEGWAAALAAQRITDEVLARLEEIVADMERLLAQGKPLEYSEANALFHHHVLQAARNPRLRQSIESLQTALIRYRFRALLVPGRSAESVADHARILEALRSRSSEESERAMRQHIAAVARNMVEAQRFMEL